MRTGRLLRVVSLAVVVGLLGTQPVALADEVVADDLIVQGGLCAGFTCANGEPLDAGGDFRFKGNAPVMRFIDTTDGHVWSILADGLQFQINDVSTNVFAVLRGSGGKVGIGTPLPAQKLHVRQDQNANSFLLMQNNTNGLNSAAVIRTQADVAMQNFQSHASSRTLVRWGVPLGGWNEFLAVVGDGLAMGTFGNAPFILGTAATARMTFDGDSNVIDFAGGGQYNGASFLDASSRAFKQDVRPLEPDAALDALAGLEPVTFAYTGAPGDGRVGFIAEDVPELVATPGRQNLSALEIVAVLTKVVKEQQKALDEQRKVAQEQQKAIAELAARLASVETRP